MDPKQPTNPPARSFAHIIPLLVAIAMLVWGAALAVKHQNWTILAGGGVALVTVLSLWQVGRTIEGSQNASVAAQSHAAALGERVEQIAVMLNVISEQQLLSDRAKSVAYREKDSEALRRAIREEIAKSNYDGAIVLADDMERAFGYKAEAEQFRTEITERRDEAQRKQVGEAMTGVDRLVREERWTEAFREAERVAERFPALESVKLLPKEIEMRREARKKQLLVEWNDSIKRHDTDGSIALLKRLDLYLTPTEAESLQESARGVFKEKLNGLRTQFSLAVQDHHWQDALRLGEEIMRDFPNSRLAIEVKESLEALKQHAAEDEPATARA